MDPIPKEPLPKPYFTAEHTAATVAALEESRQTTYESLDDVAKEERAEQATEDIRNKYASIGPSKIAESIEAIRNGSNRSQMDKEGGRVSREELKARRAIDPYFSYSPSDLLETIKPSSPISCAAEFQALSADAQAMYLIGLRATIARRHMAGSSYDSAQIYGVLPDDIIRQEAELYTAIVNQYTEGLTNTEEFRVARQNSVLALDTADIYDDGPLLPIDISAVYSALKRNGTMTVSDSHDLDDRQRRNRIGADYIQAAAELAADRLIEGIA